MSAKNAQTNYGRAFTLLAGIRADGTAFIAFPSACFKDTQWLVMKAECACKNFLQDIRPFYRCGGSAG